VLVVPLLPLQIICELSGPNSAHRVGKLQLRTSSHRSASTMVRTDNRTWVGHLTRRWKRPFAERDQRPDPSQNDTHNLLIRIPCPNQTRRTRQKAPALFPSSPNPNNQRLVTNRSCPATQTTRIRFVSQPHPGDTSKTNTQQCACVDFDPRRISQPTMPPPRSNPMSPARMPFQPEPFIVAPLPNVRLELG